MMKKIKIIYNPSSGRRMVYNKLEKISIMLLELGYTLSKFSTEKKNDAKEEALRTCNEFWDLILVCGGDGTINEVVSGVMESDKRIPIAIFAAGTVNDFANAMSLPRSAKEFVNMIVSGETKKIDIGKVKDNYFINVAAGGLLTAVAHNAGVELKTLFGKLGYYLEGLKSISAQNLSGTNMRVVSDEFVYEGDVLLFLVSNSQSVGGMKWAAPDAEVSDGKLDVIIVKSLDIQNILDILIKLQNGQHVENERIEYFKTESIYIESNDDIEIDVDGELAGHLPSEFKVIKNAIDILIN